MQATLIGLSLNNAAYLSEIIRGSLNAVESGQMDACLSVGMTKSASYATDYLSASYSGCGTVTWK